MKIEHLPPVQFVEDDLPEVAVWTWAEQQSWQGDCKDGKFQSPVTIDSHTTVTKPQANIQFQYDESPATVAKFNGHEVDITGQFGKLILVKDSKHFETYKATQLNFKFPAEHNIDNNSDGVPAQGELQVTHVNENNGKQVIVSFLLAPGDVANLEENKFLEALFPESWSLDQDKQITLPDAINLNQLEKVGLSSNFNKSFYQYQGSLSSPPCTEGVTHVVMKTQIEVQPLLLDALSKSYDSEINPNGNARSSRPPTRFQRIYYHQDNYQSCPSKIDIGGELQKAKQDLADAKAAVPKTTTGPPTNDNEGPTIVDTITDIKKYFYLPKGKTEKQVLGQLRPDFKIEEIEQDRLQPHEQKVLQQGKIIQGLADAVNPERTEEGFQEAVELRKKQEKAVAGEESDDDSTEEKEDAPLVVDSAPVTALNPNVRFQQQHQKDRRNRH